MVKLAEIPGRVQLYDGCGTRTAVPCRFNSDVTKRIYVLPRVLVLGIYETDMHSQTFEMELQIEFAWHDPEFVAAMEEADWKRGHQERGWQEQMRLTCWHPGAECVNCSDMKALEYWYNVDKRQSLVSFRCRLRGVFRERYEISAFPFDTQAACSSASHASASSLSLVCCALSCRRVRFDTL